MTERKRRVSHHRHESNSEPEWREMGEGPIWHPPEKDMAPASRALAKHQPESSAVSKIRLTTDDVLDALGAYFAKPQGPIIGTGLTGPEIADVMRCGITRAREAIKTGLEQGILEHVTVERTRLDGRRTNIVGYRMKPGAVQPAAAIAPAPKALPAGRRAGKASRRGKR